MPHIKFDNPTIGEADGFATLHFSLSEPSAQTVSFHYDFSTGSATNFNDFPNFSGEISFAPGQTTATLRIQIYEDQYVEAPETFFATFSSPVNATLERSAAAITIIDNDATVGTPSISVANTVVDEKDGFAYFVVSLDRPSNSDVSVNYDNQNGSASAGSDYVAQSGTLVFHPGETAKTVAVPIIDNNLPEAQETFNLLLSHAVGGNLGDASGTARIGASDMATADLPQIRVANTTIGEADGFADVVFSLNAPSLQAVSVSYGFSQGSATNFNDFPNFSGSVSFAPGETSKTVRIATYEDSYHEAPETLLVTLGSAVNGTLERSSAAITIIDNDATVGTPSIAIGDTVIDEKAGVAQFVVTLDKPALGNVAINYATQDGSALAGSDYTAQNGTLVFRPGETSKTVSVLINDDNTPEGAETFHMVLTTPTGATLADGVGSARIGASDNPALDKPQISASDTMVGEGDGFADVVLTLNAPSLQAVSVNYGYSSGSATNFNDYPNFSGSVSFAPGETSKTVRVAIYEDSQVESLESFRITFGTPVNATLASTSASISIVDNDSSSHFYHYGMGNDIYNISSNDVVYETPDGGIDLVRFAMADYALPASVENAEGNAQANRISGNELANRFSGLGGDDVINGGAGIDTALYQGNRANFTVSANGNGFTVTDKTGVEGVDTLLNVERIQFADATLALDISGAAGQAYRVYQAAFNRTPDAGGLGFWISVLDGGARLTDVAAGFVNSDEFRTLYGNNPVNTDIVTKFYANVLHRAPDQGGFDFWVGVLDRHDASSAEVLAQFSESPENQAALASVIGNGFAYTPFG